MSASIFAAAAISWSATPASDEIAKARHWASAKFLGIQPAHASGPGLNVLANLGEVQLNARVGKPLKLGETQYTHGLYCHAISSVLVRLPGPGKTFEAVVGVDHNESTSGGRGSVVFSVVVAGKQAFQSSVMHGGEPGVAVNVNLNGETSLTLNVGDAGDGEPCDQSDWADARVTLLDGRTIWLSDLPISHAAPDDVSAEPPFSFTYSGKPFCELVKGWKVERTSENLDAVRTRHTVTYAEPSGGLVVRCVAVEYSDFPTLEWTVYFKNTGSADTGILENIQALDTSFQRGPEGEFVLHHQKGTPAEATDYRPFATELTPNLGKQFNGAEGRPSGGDLPYFNLEWKGQGVIVAVGWPGQWSASFKHDQAGSMAVTAGQELTHLKLRPGEEIRTPLMVLQFWNGDPVRAQNVWRRWMMAHNMPKPGGSLPEPFVAACSSHQFGEMINANEGNQKLFIDRYLAEGLKIDYWWMDAGWYTNNGTWWNTGTWEVDRKRFPGGLRAVSDHAREKGTKTIVWFEPERVSAGTWLWDNKPEWILKSSSFAESWGRLLNLGNPDARKWVTERVDALIKSEGIDLYRQDYNIRPLSFWRDNDAPDRQGITENLYVQGYLAFWDELRKRHPDMLIDTCASGGTRNDLETLRRAVPLLRSDCILEPIGQQNHTYGISFWIPFYGTGLKYSDSYQLRSSMCPVQISCCDVRDTTLDYPALRSYFQQFSEVAPNFYGDYYPLTAYRPELDVWMAWQFDRSEEGRGMVQAFRRPESVFEVARLKLRGLDPAATYEVTDLDTGKSDRSSGKELSELGLRVTITSCPGSALFTYSRVKS